ncbi:MAG TPA: hypothetical protein VE871_10715 [Longimicrobium sp.]|nr:hypothetical protein [Longimicrobium sp.]
MRKLKLNLDALNVESFGTAETTDEIGTVRANQEQNEEYSDSEVTGCLCDTQGSVTFTRGYDCHSLRLC